MFKQKWNQIKHSPLSIFPRTLRKWLRESTGLVLGKTSYLFKPYQTFTQNFHSKLSLKTFTQNLPRTFKKLEFKWTSVYFLEAVETTENIQAQKLEEKTWVEVIWVYYYYALFRDVIKKHPFSEWCPHTEKEREGGMSKIWDKNQLWFVLVALTNIS